MGRRKEMTRQILPAKNWRDGNIFEELKTRVENDALSKAALKLIENARHAGHAALELNLTWDRANPESICAVRLQDVLHLRDLLVRRKDEDSNRG